MARTVGASQINMTPAERVAFEENRLLKLVDQALFQYGPRRALAKLHRTEIQRPLGRDARSWKFTEYRHTLERIIERKHELQ